MKATRGISLQESFRMVKELGGEVKPLRKSGEAMVILPGYARRCRVNVRKKSAPRILTARLGKLLRIKARNKAAKEAVAAYASSFQPTEGRPFPAPVDMQKVQAFQDPATQRIEKINEVLQSLARAFGASNGIPPYHELRGVVKKLGDDHAVLLDFQGKLSERLERVEKLIDGLGVLFR